MSSYQLPLTAPPANAPRHQSRIPIHVAFSPTQDAIAALWETGYIEFTDLRTRLGPGRGKVMDPVKLWAGFVAGDERTVSRISKYRQIQVLTANRPGEDSIKFAVLGSPTTQDGKDTITIVDIAQGKIIESVSIDLPQQGGRMVPSDNQVWWHSPDGELLTGSLLTSISVPR